MMHDHSHEHGGEEEHGQTAGHSHDHDHGRWEVTSGDLEESFVSNSRRQAQADDTALEQAQETTRKLKCATIFVLMFFVVEIVGGIWSGSLAIISDATHLLADVSSFILAIVANEIATQPASNSLTYGPVRAEVLSALFSTALILVLSLGLLYEAVMRIIDLSCGDGADVDGKMMSGIAFLGLLVNVVLLCILGDEHDGHGHDHSHCDGHTHNDSGHEHSDGGNYLEGEKVVDALMAPEGDLEGELGSLVVVSSSVDEYGSLQAGGVAGENGGGEAKEISAKLKRSINMDAAILHAVTDLIQSAGVLVAGLLIWYNPEWKWVDPVVTLVFVVLVMNSTRWLLNKAFNVLLEGVPDSIDIAKLRDRLSQIPGVTDVHCLHAWSLTLGRTVVTAHIKATETERALVEAHNICEDMGVSHSTIQVQLDHCEPTTCLHPCVSAVGSCCDTSLVSSSLGSKPGGG